MRYVNDYDDDDGEDEMRAIRVRGDMSVAHMRLFLFDGSLSHCSVSVCVSIHQNCVYAEVYKTFHMRLHAHHISMSNTPYIECSDKICLIHVHFGFRMNSMHLSISLCVRARLCVRTSKMAISNPIIEILIIVCKIFCVLHSTACAYFECKSALDKK